MYANINTVTFLGTETKNIETQVHFTPGKPNINIVGLPDKSVAESCDRLLSTFHSIGLGLPEKRIIVNLAPADIHKIGTHYDLPIALGILTCMNIIDKETIASYIILGELGLNGSIAPVNGVLPTAISATAQNKGIICPQYNGHEACWANDQLEIIAPNHLLELINHFKGTQIIERPKAKKENLRTSYPDISDVKGQKSAKRALEIAAAGNHNMLMIGPPGAGKSMLAQRLPGILPPPSNKEILDISIIGSITGQLSNDKSLIYQRPFRSPHHSCSMAAMIGGGRNVKPGEITLSHKGVLFLDELPEYSRNTIESLRQTMETGTISIARANEHITYPADFILLAAMNPCRCGYLGEKKRECNRAPECAAQYQSKISGPILDRIDIHIEVPSTPVTDLHNKASEEPSSIILERVTNARSIQYERYNHLGITTNAEASGDILLDNAHITEDSLALLKKAAKTMHLSMRGYTRVIRVARTIADLESSNNVIKHHVAEALHYRSTLKNLY